MAAASELKEQYNNTRIRGVERTDSQVSIPQAFPQVSIVTKGEEQMVLFPTYAKRHVREFGGGGAAAAVESRFPPGHSFQAAAATAAQMGLTEEEYWKLEWARAEDEKAVVDVDVRGWIYMPNKGPMTRRNRMLVGLARRLSGIPPPTTGQSEHAASSHEQYEKIREERRIAREAQEIERRGQGEKEAAIRGEYSETPTGSQGGSSHVPVSPPSPPPPPTRTATGLQPDLTDSELAVANANLMARLGPFMTTPLVQKPITIFFYNDEQSRSHTVLTDDSGHFSTRVALEFVPTHVRVLANENISAVKPVQIIESKGVSLISDIDDTIKRSNIWMGAREIFRNTFVRDLGDLTVDGVREWYHAMHELGVKLHYCSNSPWQLFPVLATFFHTAGLPQGSIHLKHYSGMLQGIFEPVAERKKGTLEAILRDFPERKFLLIGDSGEADLEVYTELVVANPGRILAVFIRDVTTPEQMGFFDSSFSLGAELRERQGSNIRPGPGGTASEEPESRPQPPPRIIPPAPPPSSGPVMGTLIDFSDDPAQVNVGKDQGPPISALSLSDNQPRKAPPPRPAKPAALRSTPSDLGAGSQRASSAGPETAPSPPQRTQTSRSTPLPANSNNSTKPTPPPPPPPRRRGTQPAAPVTAETSLSPPPPRPPSRVSTTYSSTGTYSGTPGGGGVSLSETATSSPGNGGGGGGGGVGGGGAAAAAAINKKVDLWLRRLARAHEVLDAHGVKLYTWRKGEDVIKEAEGIVKEALREVRGDGR
ncbi:hypothetical protein VTK26DRAFT_7220 [Humicola hyalothermophila]